MSSEVVPTPTPKENERVAPQNYRDVDPEEFDRRDAVSQSRRPAGDFVGYWSPKVGNAQMPSRNVIRILPPHHKMPADPFVMARMHFLPSNEVNKNTGKAIMIGINCLKPFGKQCPACDKVAHDLAEADALDSPEQVEAAKKAARDAGAKDRYFCQIIDIDDQAKGVQRYAFGPDTETKIRRTFRDDENKFRNVAHPRSGRDIIMKVGKRPGTTFNDYDIRAKETSTPIANMEWLEAIEDLTELTLEPKYDDVEMASRGIRPQRGGSSAPRTATRPAEPETEAETEAEPEEKPEKPARGKKTEKAAKAEPEEDQV